jgi:hypothetical protein
MTNFSDGKHARIACTAGEWKLHGHVTCYLEASKDSDENNSQFVENLSTYRIRISSR